LLSLIHLLERRAVVSADEVALTDHLGAELTYAALAAQTNDCAGRYLEAGVQPGDVVAIMARNQAAWVTAMTGLIRVGAVRAAINWRRLAGFTCPTGVMTVEALPRNATGKVLRAALREPFWAGRDRRVS
jgi:acyl-CoA synthetase (AMP-forming)/AMP-acid ligase II